MEDNLPLVSIITVNYNGSHLLKDCFDSLSALNYPQDKIEIIMVDNNSADDSVDFTAKNFPQARIIKNKVNNYCAANNLGIKDSRGEFVCLINNDVRLEPDWVIGLIKVFNAGSKIGAAVGRILFPDGTLQNTGLYDLPDFYWSDRGFKEENRGQYNSIEYVNSVSHCAVMYGRRCLQDIGCLDSDFNMYLEDVDMSFRAAKNGWRLVYVPGSIAYHKFHGTADEKDVAFYCERNRLLFIAKHYPEKLADSLLGRGYFTVLNNRNDLLGILPEILLKVNKHYGAQRAGELFPAILNSIRKIYNLEKDSLVKQLDALKLEIARKEQIIAHRDKEIALQGRCVADSEVPCLQARVSCLEAEVKEKDEHLARYEQIIVQKDSELASQWRHIVDKDGEISCLQSRISCLEAEVREKGDNLSRKDEIIARKDDELAAQGQCIVEKNGAVSCLQAQIQQIYTSETYRFLARPLWKMLDAFKRKKREVPSRLKTETLVIKPFCVSAGETRIALDYLIKTALKQDIVLLANVFQDDYELFLKEENLQEKILYCPSRNKLSKGELFRLILRIRKRRFSETILLAGNPPRQGYRKGKLLAAFSGAGRINVFFINPRRMEPLNKVNSACKAIFGSIYSNVLLFLVVGLFVGFVGIPLKIRKILLRK